MNERMYERSICSPFGVAALHLMSVPSMYISELYRRKCGVEVLDWLGEHEFVDLYKCSRTGYKFWRPEAIAGDDLFYEVISSEWPNYYQTTRWEYDLTKRHLMGAKDLLEIGCGKGHYLRRLEGCIDNCIGIEFNNKAIANKVTSYPIVPKSIEEFSEKNSDCFDVVCSFQVLEHIPDPASFLLASIKTLRRGGKLIVSTPNNDYHAYINQEDAFDLPPHHIGHFNSAVYQSIGDYLGVDLVDIYQQRRIDPRPFVTSRSASGIMYNLIRKIVSGLNYVGYSYIGEPGPNIMAVYTKP